MAFIIQNLSEIAKQRPLQSFGRNVTHLYSLHVQIFNNDFVIIVDQLGRKLLNDIMLNVGNFSIITLQLGFRFNVIV